MTGTLMAITSAFMFLSAAKPDPYLILENPSRAELESKFNAGLKPLVFAKDDVFALTNQADCLSAAVFDVIPKQNLLHTWRKLDVKVLYAVSYDIEGSAEYFRRSCAFIPVKYGADGVFIKNPRELPPAWKSALGEAIKDAKTADYLKELAIKASKDENPLLHIEARRVLWWLSNMGAEWEDLDCLRLECVAYAKRLEQLLGLPARDLPVDYTPMQDTGIMPFRPFGKTPANLRQIQAAAYDNKDIPLDENGDFTFSSNEHGFSFTIRARTWPTMPQHRMPENCGKFNISFYIPSKDGKSFSPYRIVVDPEEFRVGKRAPAHGLWPGFLFTLEERFTRYISGYGMHHKRVHLRPQLRTFGPDHQDLSPSYLFAYEKDGGWKMTVNISWLSLYGQWPATKNGAFDSWYVGIDRLPCGTSPAPAAIKWPRGRESNFDKLAKRINLGEITRVYKDQLDKTWKVWRTSYNERLFRFDKTEKPTFHRYDLESDTVFLERCLNPLLDSNKNMWEMVQSDKEHPSPGFNKAPDVVQKTILRSLDKLRHLAHETSKVRRDYLRDRFAGKMPPEPKPPKKEESFGANPAAGDFIEEESFDAIELDDMEF